MKRWIGAGALTVAGLGALGWMYVNASEGDPADWHRDPMSVEGAGRPNEYRVAPPEAAVAANPAPVFDATPAELAIAFDRVAMAAPRTRRLAGDPADGFTTYVQRSALFGWPDYISVRAVPVEDGSTLAIWSRSRYGYSDLGVNAERVEAWLSRLEAALR